MNLELAALVKRIDPDRYFCTLLAPEPARNALLTLYAFDHELARARMVASQPLLALIRLQWWREVVEGQNRRHEVATPLSALLESGQLDRQDCLAMIEGREMEVEIEFPTSTQFETYCLTAHGTVMAAAGKLLGEDPAPLRLPGAGCGAVWVLKKRAAWATGFDAEALAASWLQSIPRRSVAALPALLARRDLPDLKRPRLLWDQLAVVRQRYLRF